MKSSLLRSPLVAAALLVALVVIAYLPAFGAGYLWDDDTLLTDNPLIRSPDGLWRMWFRNTTLDYFPVTSSSFWLEYRLWGEFTVGYHAVNILLHATSTVLVWRILLRLGIPEAWLVAALWGVHPVTVSSVAWISERKNTLSMLLGCLSVLAWLQFEGSGRRRWYWAALAAFVLAMLAKTSMVTLPFILPLLNWWRHGRLTKDDLLRAVPFLAVSLVLGWVTLQYQLGHDAGPRIAPLTAALATVPRGAVLAGQALGFYLWKDVCPVGLAMVYPQWHIDPTNPLDSIATVAIVVGLIGLWCGRGNPAVRATFFAAAFFTLALAPILGFLPASYMKQHAFVADHWQYLALIGPLAWGVAAADRFLPAGRGRATLGVGLIVVLATLTFRHAAVYRSPESLWRHNIAVADCWSARVGLARLLSAEGKDDEAIAALHQALVLKPDAVPAHIQLGEIQLKCGRHEAAIDAFRTAFNLGGGGDAMQREGVVRAIKGDLAGAEECFARAADEAPESATVQVDWGRSLELLGRRVEAEARYRAALHRNPDLTGGLNSLAFLLASRPAGEGAATEAVALARRACRLSAESDPAILDTLATALAAAGEFAAAVETAEKALELAESRGEPALAEEIRGHRDLFRAGLPYRQP